MGESEREKLVGYIDLFAGKRVAVIGDIAIDHSEFGGISRMNPERRSVPLLTIRDDYVLREGEILGEDTQDRENVVNRLGCAGNVASNLAALGARVNLSGIVGRDFFGDVVKRKCIEQKIQLRFAYGGGRTIVKSRYYNGTEYVLRVDHDGCLDPMSEELERNFLGDLIESEVDAIILSDYNKRVFRGRGFAKGVLEYAIEKGIPVMVDPKPDNFEKFAEATIFRPNESEARIIAGLSEDASIEDVLRRVKDLSRAKFVVVTLGSEGMAYHDGDFHYIPTNGERALDVTGAGDTVLSALTLSYLAGANLSDSCRIANYAAGIAVGRPGTVAVKRDELVARILEGD